MKIIIHIMLGLSPLLILSFYLFLKKKYRIVSILITFLAIVIDVFAFSNLKYSIFSNQSNEMKQDAYVMVIKQSLLNEDYENAKVFINHCEERYGETFESILSLARYELLNHNVEEAGLLYEKAQWIDESKSISKEEKEIYEYIKSNQLVNMTSGYSEVAMANYIDLVGKKPGDYGYDTSSKRLLEVNSKMLEAAQRGVSKEIEEEYESASHNDFIEDLQRGLDLKTELDQMYGEYLTYGSVDEDRVEYIEKNLGKIYGQYQELFSEDLLHNSYYQVLLMNENYKKLIRLTSDTDDLELYMLLSELYMSGVITKDDLEQVDFLDDLEDYNEVLEICEDVARDYRYENKRKAPKKVAELEEKVTSIENTIENFQLVELQLQMENITAEEEDKSKFKLILAKINEYLGNEEKAQTYIEEALEAANESKDGSYKKVMEQINDVIKSNSDISELKEVSNYIVKAYEEALPVKILESSIENTDFSDFVSDYVSTKQAMINICGINIEDFPKVTAYVQFGTPIKNAELLEVKDVNQIMTDVKLTKKNYAEANILLTCDISGSMSGNEEQLKNAVATFAEYKTDIEQIGLIGFNDGIVFDTAFYDQKDQLLNYTDQLTPDGGTNIFGAIQHSITKFGNDSSVSKTVIVMTDGEDGYSPSKEELENLRRTCTQNNITIYTVGLGSSVNAEYLSNLASYGNGKFVYCNNAASLESLFDFIHSQIDNTYELTYTAKDEVTNKRQLTVTNMSDNSSDTKTYYLNSEDEMNDAKDDIFSNDVVGDIWVDGVAMKNIYKSNGCQIPMELVGSGFSQINVAKIQMKDMKNKVTNLEGKVVDNTHISFHLPDSIEMGSYDLSLVADGTIYEVMNAFTVYDSTSRVKISFGAYEFEANVVNEISNDEYILVGNVVLNDYLHFKGEIRLYGDLKGTQIRMSDSYGSYVNCSKGLPGLMGVFYQGAIFIPRFNEITLYDDQVNQYDFSEYNVDSVNVYDDVTILSFVFEEAGMSLYPDRVEFNLLEFALDFPGLKEILSTHKIIEHPFTAVDCKAIVTGETLGLIGEVAGSVEEVELFNIGVLPVSFDEFSASIDTLEHNYELSAKVAVDFSDLLGDTDKEAAFGFTLGYVEGKFDTIILNADFDISLKTAVPVTLCDFKIGLEEMSQSPQGANIGTVVLNSYILAGLDVKVAEVKDIFKPAAAILGDVCFMNIDDITLKVRFSNFSLDFSATAMLFDAIDLGGVQVNIGNFTYDNYLLNINDDAVGVFVELRQGFFWDTPNITVDVSGTGEVTINNLFSGAMVTGTINYDVDVLWIEKSENMRGNILVGLHNNAKQFSIIIKGTNVKNNKRGGVHLCFKDGNLLPSVDFY